MDKTLQENYDSYRKQLESLIADERTAIVVPLMACGLKPKITEEWFMGDEVRGKYTF